MNWEWHKNPRSVFIIFPNGFIIGMTLWVMIMMITGVLIYIQSDQNLSDKLKLARKDNPPHPVAMKQAFNNLIPIEFQMRSWIVRFYSILKREHTW